MRLSLSDDMNAALAVEQLGELSARGIKLRTRALTTTLFARLALSDLFLHGIGGAKYDQVTDLIAALFCGFPLPTFATVSATLRLPIERERVENGNGRPIDEQLRAITYHPERFVDANGFASADAQSRVTELVATKRKWVETIKSPTNAHERHVAIRAANESLQPYLASLRERLSASAMELENRRRGNAILNSREYSFCLFPQRHLERLVLDDA